jgi:hypothetical protein
VSGVDHVPWADGIHVNIRLEEHKLCLLVLTGVHADGRRSSSRWCRFHKIANVFVGLAEVGAFDNYPAEHWIHPPTTNPIEWRAVTAPHLVALVRAGATFVNGIPAERADEQTTATTA